MCAHVSRVFLLLVGLTVGFDHALPVPRLARAALDARMVRAAAARTAVHESGDDPPPIVWTIAGSDSGGGAGIQADLHTIHALGCHACSVPTALTAQNSHEVRMVEYPSREMLQVTMGALEDDLPARAIKLGMLGNQEVMEEVAALLNRFSGSVVCDPVMVTTSGSRLIDEGAQEHLVTHIFPNADVVTPNMPETEALLGRQITSAEEVEAAAAELLAMGAKSVLIKGGHAFAAENADDGEGDRFSMDFWADGAARWWLTAPRIPTEHTHGTGCTLSSAITAALALGYPTVDAVVIGKAYVTRGIRQAVGFGKGPGPVAHTGWPTDSRDFPLLTPRPPSPALLAMHDRSNGAARFPRLARGGMGLYPLVNSAEGARRLLECGEPVPDLQLRIKSSDAALLEREIAATRELCQARGTRLWINDHWRLAVKLSVFGVHMGHEDLLALLEQPGQAELIELVQSGVRLGLSTHCFSELCVANAVCPSYVSLGPIFETTSKDVPFGPQGAAAVERWRAVLGDDVPLVVIGGISTTEQGRAMVQAGADSVAVIGALSEGAVEASDAGELAGLVGEWNALFENTGA